MYNVKILKYPDGWQIRAYNKPVGMNTYNPVDNELDMDLHDVDGNVVQKVTLGSETGRVDGSFIAVNPFTGELERMNYFDEKTEDDRVRSVKVSMNRTVNKVYSLARSNVWDWFVTLTFDPQKVDSFDYECCTKALQNWLIVQRRNCPNLKYIIVPEKHESGRFHFHGLIANCDGLDFAESGHFTKDQQVIYNIGKYRLGWSTATKVVDNERVTKYISKYITKDLCAVAFNKKRYWTSRNLDEVETEEYLLIDGEMEQYEKMLQENCKWSKTVNGENVSTTYYEMGVTDNENKC